MAVDVVDDVLMTFAAGVFRDPPAAFLDLDRLVEIARGERERMKKSVLGFSEILGDKPGRRVAIVAGRDRAVARLDPGIEMVLHDVAVGAGVGIVAEIGRALGIDEGETPEADDQTHGKSYRYRQQRCHAGCLGARPLRQVCFHGRPLIKSSEPPVSIRPWSSRGLIF